MKNKTQYSKRSKRTNDSKFRNKRQANGKRSERNDADYNPHDSRADDISSLNDISWYSKYPDLLTAAASIPFPFRPGMSIPFGNYTDANAVTWNTYVNVPGVATLSWMPSIGQSTQVTDAINVAAKELYAKVRSAFSGSLDADPQDFMIYLMALDSYFSYIGALKRIFRILDAYSPQNYELPSTLLQALGIGPNSIVALRKDKMNFLSLINQLCYQARKFHLPAVMDIFNRHYWMNDNVYTDAATLNSQMYTFRQDYFWVYQSDVYVVDSTGTKTTVQAGGLGILQAPWISLGDNLNPGVLYNIGLSMISALANSDDAYTISGYLARAYEGVPQFVVEPLTGTEEFTPVYAEEVLMQIENSFAIGSATATIKQLSPQNAAIAQMESSNTLYWIPSFDVTKTIYSASVSSYAAYPIKNSLLTLRTDTPTAADVTIASRLHASCSIATSTAATIIAGTEIPLQWIIYATVKFNTPGLPSSVVETPLQQALGLGVLSTNNALFNAMLKLSNFDWAPLIYFVRSDSKSTESTADDVSEMIAYGDYHNMTLLTPTQLEQINRVCVLSEFNAFNI